MSEGQWQVERPARREFLRATALGLAGIVLACSRPKSPAKSSTKHQAPARPPHWQPSSNHSELNPFIVLGDPRGGVDLVVARTEMGQSIRTTLAMLIAEELRVPWSTIRVHQADADKRYGSQHTDGSISVYEDFDRMRTMGASAREMLLAAAASRWNVAADDLIAEDGSIKNPATDQELSYSELVSAAAKLVPPKSPKLRGPNDWQLIGTPVHSIDTPAIVRGQQDFAIDVERPGLLHASLERAPRRGATIVKLNDTAARAFPGVKHILRIPATPEPANTPEAVAVIARSSWHAQEARRLLAIEWSPGPFAESNEAQLKSELHNSLATTGKVYRTEGKATEKLDRASAKVLHTAEYYSPARPHLPMEPPVCTVQFEGRSKCEIWAPTQSPQKTRETVAKLLKLDEPQVQLHVCRAGGAFGRKGQRDYVVEAALVAQQLPGIPVKVTWTREDEVRHGYYRPACAQRLRAALDRTGRIEAWEHQSAFPAIMRTFRAHERLPGNWEMRLGASSLALDIPHIHVEGRGPDSPLRSGWVRAVHHVAHAWAINDFLDRIAHQLGRDPIDYQLEMLPKRAPEDNKYAIPNPARLRKVARTLQRFADYERLRGQGAKLGFALHGSFRSYAAALVEVVRDGRHGPLGGFRPSRVWCVVDCGRVVNPNHARAQVEGAVHFGLSAAIWGGIEVEQGSVRNENFSDLPVLRLDHAPDVHVQFIDTTEPPTGLGEPGTPVVAPALGNAMFAATGQRCATLPMADFAWKRG